ncbi:terpene synthase family protein [Streptomyces sp. NPDC050803]|uniref:terpene synthase family protein n=1 Tax=unclassified Streptomyces TaxID=2593676 RepID=UPI0034311210
MLCLLLYAVETPETTPLAASRYPAALHDLHTRLARRASPVQLDRWAEAVRGWFLAEIWRAGNIDREIVPSVDDYARLRLYSGGGMAFRCRGPQPRQRTRPLRP